MSFTRILALLCGVASVLHGAPRPPSPDTFDGWVNQLTADWIRDPAFGADPAAGSGDDDEAGALWSEGLQARRDRR